MRLSYSSQIKSPLRWCGLSDVIPLVTLVFMVCCPCCERAGFTVPALFGFLGVRRSRSVGHSGY